MDKETRARMITPVINGRRARNPIMASIPRTAQFRNSFSSTLRGCHLFRRTADMLEGLPSREPVGVCSEDKPFPRQPNISAEPGLNSPRSTWNLSLRTPHQGHSPVGIHALAREAILLLVFRRTMSSPYRKPSRRAVQQSRPEARIRTLVTSASVYRPGRKQIRIHTERRRKSKASMGDRSFTENPIPNSRKGTWKQGNTSGTAASSVQGENPISKNGAPMPRKFLRQCQKAMKILQKI